MTSQQSNQMHQKTTHATEPPLAKQFHIAIALKVEQRSGRIIQLEQTEWIVVACV